MARTAGWSSSPAAGKRIGWRTGWLESLRRRKRHRKPVLEVTWYNQPVIPSGYRGRIG